MVSIQVISLGSDPLNFIEDQAGNRMKANIQPTLSVSGTTVDTMTPRILSVTKNIGVETHVRVGTVVDLVTHFSRPVIVTGSPRLTLNIGGQSTTSALYQKTGDFTHSTTHTFRYTVSAGHNGDIQVVGLGSDPLNLIEDEVGNKMKANIQPALLVSETIVDTVIPRILSVTKNHGIKTHVELGTIVDLVAHFGEPVIVTGSPRLTLNIGGQSTASALYQNAEGSAYSQTHTFRYTVDAEHNGNIQVTSLNSDVTQFY